MVKVLIALAFAFMLQAVLSPRVEAQANCTAYDTYCAACGDPFLPGMHNCEPEAPFIDVCELPFWGCPPKNGAAETAPKCDCGNANPQTNPTGGNPISLASGDTFIVKTDTKIPGLGGGLELTRQWNSLWPAADSAYQIGIFGSNWRSTYEERVFVGSDNYFKYLESDGTILSFGFGPGAPPKWRSFYPTSPFLMLATPVASSGKSFGAEGGAGGPSVGVYILPAYFSVMFGNGEERRFDIDTGKLVAILDRNGNETTVSYDSDGRLSTVADAAGQHLYFNYGGSGALVTSVTTDFGVSMSYSYDDDGRLIEVTEPDSTTISYDYNSQSLITSVLDSNGHVLETHTYDTSNRGLTSSQADGVNAVTINY